MFEKEFVFKVGRACNNNCTYCDLLGIKAEKDKTFNEIKKELKKLNEKNYFRIIFPCNSDIRKDFIEILKFCNGLGFEVVLRSNGRMFSYLDYVKEVSRYVDFFEVFLNGNHDVVSRVKCLNSVIKGVKNLLKLNCDLQVNTIILNDSLHFLKDLFFNCKKIGVFKIWTIFPIVKDNSEIVPEIKNSYLKIDECLKHASELGLEIVTGKVFFNPYIPDDLNLDYDTGKVLFEKKVFGGNKKISVIIPTYNREKLLKNCLLSLLYQDYPKKYYELIVVDDGGNDGTLDMVKGLDINLDFKYVYWPRNKPYVFGEAGNRAGPARNLGVKVSGGELLIFLDSDILVDKKFIFFHEKVHEKDKIIYSIRRKDLALVYDYDDFLNKKKKGLLELKENLVTNLLLEQIEKLKMEQKNLSDSKYPWLYFMSHNVSVKKKYFFKNWFDDNFVFYGLEDSEWLYRYANLGFQVEFDDDNVVYHQDHNLEFFTNKNRLRVYFINQDLFYSKHKDIRFMHYYICFRYFIHINEEKKIEKILPFYNLCQRPNTLLKKTYKENYLLNKKEFIGRKLNLTTYPSRLYIELTRNCNMKCKMCYQYFIDNNSSKVMSFDLFKKIADELFLYAKFVDLRGFGESIILPNFLDYVNYALKFDCDFGLISNLSVKNDKLWGHLIKNNLWIGISIDGADKKTYGEIRNEKYFNQVVKNIKLLVSLSKKYKTDIKRLYFIVVVQQANIGKLDEIVLLAKKLGIKKIEFKPVNSHDSSVNFSGIKKLMRENIKSPIELAKKEGIKLKLTGSFFNEVFEKKLDYEIMKKCGRAWSQVYIAYNGFIGPCNHRHDLLFGSLKYWEFQETWNNSYFQIFRKIINTINRPERCQKCFEGYFNNEWS